MVGDPTVRWINRTEEYRWRQGMEVCECCKKGVYEQGELETSTMATPSRGGSRGNRVSEQSIDR